MNAVAAGWALVVAIAAFAGGMVAGRLASRARMRRLADGAAKLAAGNYAHRVILPGSDEAADVAASLNTIADTIQAEAERASARDAAQRQFVADISHDLRTPITSIAGYADALRRGIGDEPERYLDVIASKTESLAHLTDDLFYAARIDSGDLRLDSSELDLGEAVRRSIIGFEPQLRATGAEIRVDLPDAPCPILGDSSALARILTNLIANGVAHAAGMSEISVSLRRTGDRCCVDVANDGVPLGDGVERLFRRGEAGRGGGTGLGLSIARDLAGRMGGSMSAANSDDGRVVFTLEMPVREFSGS